MLTNEQIGDALKKLSGTLRDGEKGFSEAAEKATDPSLKTMFSELSSQRAQMANELELMTRQYGETPREGGSVVAALHRGWINVRDAISGGGDEAVVAESLRGEDTARGNYEEVLRDDLPADVKSVAESQYSKIKASYEKMAELKGQTARS
jgi:uncharacterized protein (TIGR02284 family)